MANGRHRVPHAEEIDDMVGYGALWRQLGDRDVEKAADQRGKEQENRGVGTDAETLIGIAHGSQDEHDEEKADQDGKEAGRERQVVHVTHLSVLPLDRTADGWKLLLRPIACFGQTAAGPRLTTSAVASVDSIGRRADVYWEVGSSNCAGKRSRSRRCPSSCLSQRVHRP